MNKLNLPRLKEKYKKQVLPALAKEFGVSNELALPRIIKVIVNMGVGDAVRSREVLEQAKKDLAVITGQLPQLRQARVSVASFSVRRGMPVGLKCSLRGDKMYSFLDKLFSVVLPRLRDFRGLSLKSFDKEGNYTLGIEDHTVFPEIDLARSQSRGLEVTINTKAKDQAQAKRLLELLGMPFARNQEEQARVKS